LRRAGPQADNSSGGDPFLLAQVFQDTPLAEVKQRLGDEFASALSGLTPGQWQGPVKSGYGLHLVLVSERREARLPELGEIREKVRREWLNAMRTEMTDKFYEGLLSRYTIKIEPPEEKKEAQMR
jgi:parvulin-like peptidyl-prolyl isomerase